MTYDTFSDGPAHVFVKILSVKCVLNLVKIHLEVIKRLSGNEILTSIKGHTSVTYWRKMTSNNPSLELANINGMQNSVRIHAFVLKILSGNEIPT